MDRQFIVDNGAILLYNMFHNRIGDDLYKYTLEVFYDETLYRQRRIGFYCYIEESEDQEYAAAFDILLRELPLTPDERHNREFVVKYGVELAKDITNLINFLIKKKLKLEIDKNFLDMQNDDFHQHYCFCGKEKKIISPFYKELIDRAIDNNKIFYDEDIHNCMITEKMFQTVYNNVGNIRNIVFLDEDALKYYDLQKGYLPNDKKQLVAFITKDDNVYLGAI